MFYSLFLCFYTDTQNHSLITCKTKETLHASCANPAQAEIAASSSSPADMLIKNLQKSLIVFKSIVVNTYFVKSIKRVVMESS